MRGVYKYEYDGEIIYIGKADSFLEDRIYAHATEEKFAPYIEKATVFFCETKTATETDFIETALINQHRPILNVAKKSDVITDVQVKVDWVPWEDYIARKTRAQKHPRINMAFYGDNLEFVREEAWRNKQSITEYVNSLIEQARDRKN